MRKKMSMGTGQKKRNELAESLLCEIKGRKRLIQREEEGETARRKKASFFSLKRSKRETKDPAATIFFSFQQKIKNQVRSKYNHLFLSYFNLYFDVVCELFLC